MSRRDSHRGGGRRHRRYSGTPWCPSRWSTEGAVRYTLYSVYVQDVMDEFGYFYLPTFFYQY